jgi:hypothetical protein
VSQKVIDDYMKTDQDIMRAKSNVLEQADVFQFDSVFGPNTS